MGASILTAARLRECLSYDPETGIFIRRARTAQCHQVGDRADFLVTKGALRGYHRVALLGQRYLAHRLAWLYVYGEWPTSILDHYDTCKSNNRIGNLRPSTKTLNGQNRRRAAGHNQHSDLLGAHFHKQTGRWVARIGLDGVTKHLGMFGTPEEAHAAYVLAKRQYHPAGTM